MPAKLKLEGQKFGKLTVTNLFKSHKTKGTVWSCQCECGAVFNKRLSLRSV